jgi:hypothetical protein
MASLRARTLRMLERCRRNYAITTELVMASANLIAAHYEHSDKTCWHAAATIERTMERSRWLID